MRAIRKFVGTLTGPRRYIFFIVVLIICIISLFIGIYIQFIYKYADTDPLMLGINIGSKKTEEELAILKSNFNSLFTNQIIINSENVRVDKIYPKRDLVFTSVELVDKDENYFEVNAQIPMINVVSEVADKLNSDIQENFWAVANNVMRKKDVKTIYSVNYAAFINDEVLSLVIKSSLKEGNKPEKVVVKTYNYSLENHKEVTLYEMIMAKEVTEKDIQNIINQDIKTAYINARRIADEYGTTYERDLNNDIYKLENVENYFLTQDGYVYIIYAYGNEDYTNEMDIIIF